MEQLLAQEERDRLQQRQTDKLKRRQLRFEAFLSSERDVMIVEDNRSYKLRYFLWECTQIQRERFLSLIAVYSIYFPFSNAIYCC